MRAGLGGPPPSEFPRSSFRAQKSWQHWIPHLGAGPRTWPPGASSPRVCGGLQNSTWQGQTKGNRKGLRSVSRNLHVFSAVFTSPAPPTAGAFPASETQASDRLCPFSKAASSPLVILSPFIFTIALTDFRPDLIYLAHQLSQGRDRLIHCFICGG